MQLRFLGRDEALGEVRSWFEQHPDIQKSVILECVVREDNTKASRHPSYIIPTLLCYSKLPDDIGTWYLKQAAKRLKMSPSIGESLFDLAVIQYMSVGACSGITTDRLREFAGKSKRLNQILDLRLPPLSDEATVPCGRCPKRKCEHAGRGKLDAADSGFRMGISRELR